MKKSWKRTLSLFCAAIIFWGCFLTGSVLPISADEDDDFSEKYVIFDGGTNGKTVNWSAGSHAEWSIKNFGLNIPESMPFEKIGIYIRITLDATAAAAMNTSGSIELAQATCDKSELNCSTTAVTWKAGLNEVIVPIASIGGYTDGGQERFDMYSTIHWFRFYTTPGTAALSQNSTATIWEVSIVDSTMVGLEFGAEDAYLQLTGALTATPNTIEASIKTNKLGTSFTMGLYSGARYASPIMTSKSGTITGVEGIPDGTAYVGGTVHKGGYFGTKDLVASVSIPKAYSIDQIALTFWLYTSTGEVTKSYLELTSSGKCDVEEICWTTKDAEFSNLKPGWNQIILPLNSRTGAGFDYTRINFSRFWGSPAAEDVATQDFEMYITELQFIVIDSREQETSSGMEIIDGLPTWSVLDLTKTPQNWDGGKISVGNVWKDDGTDALQPADGTIYMEVTPGATLTFANDHVNYPGVEYWKAGFTANTGNAFIAPNIPKQYTAKDLKFTFWIYIPDADLVPSNISADSPNFEFTSDGDVDGAEIDYLNMWKKIGGLQDGWNYVEIPFSEMDAASTFDLYNINFFRWTYMCSLKDTTGTVTECVRYADFRIVSTVDRIGETVPEESNTSSSTDQIDTDSAYMIFSNTGSDDKATIALWLTATGNVAWTWGGKQYISEFNAFTGEWIDLALVRDMTKKQFLLYADGTLVAQMDATGSADLVPTTPHSIGADAAGKGQFSGWIADVRAWSDVRSAEEIQKNRIKKLGCSSNGLDETTQGLLGSWLLIGSIDDILSTMTDTSKYQNHAVFRGSRANDWSDYQIPTDVIGEDYFTIVFIPDIQELVTGTFTEEWMAAAQWISDNVKNENIIHVIGAGDSTWTDSPAQWEVARAGFDLFANKVSWSNMTGNHDYPGSCTPVNNPDYTLRDSSNYQSYFGMNYIEETMAYTYFVDDFDDPYEISTTENAYYRFKINGIQWMILQLEYLPRAHVIEWANEILEEYPDDNVIVTTHSYISGDKATYCTQWMPYTNQDDEIGGYIGSLMGESWPNGSTKPIWDNLIYNHDNVKLLLCGHDATSDGHVLTRLDQNAAGNTVPQVMINAQDLDVSYFKNDAMGMLGILRFSADGTKVEIQYYSPYHDGTFQPSNPEMLSLTLNVNGNTKSPSVDQSENLDPVDSPEEPDNSSSRRMHWIWIVVGVVAILAAAAAIAAVMILKKKK